MAKCCIKIPLETLWGIYAPISFIWHQASVWWKSSLSPSVSLCLPLFLFSISFSSSRPSVPPFPSLPPSPSLFPLLPSSFPPSFPSSIPPPNLLHPQALFVHRTSGSCLYLGKGKYYQVSVNICSFYQSPALGTFGSDHSCLFQIDFSPSWGFITSGLVYPSRHHCVEK